MDVGLAIYALYLWFGIGGQLHGKPTSATFDAIFAGLLLPILTSAGAMGLAWWRPLPLTESKWWFGVIVAFLVGILTLIAGACLFIFVLIAFSGYC